MSDTVVSPELVVTTDLSRLCHGCEFRKYGTSRWKIALTWFSCSARAGGADEGPAVAADAVGCAGARPATRLAGKLDGEGGPGGRADRDRRADRREARGVSGLRRRTARWPACCRSPVRVR